MPRTIVSIDPGIEDTWTMCLFKAPVNIEDARRPYPFTCISETMPPWDDPDAVKKHGQKLLEELETHPAIKKAIEMALMTPPGVTRPVYFRLLEEDAERLCWETLYADKNTFLGLDARWPIGRIADSVVDRHLPPQDFRQPLKLAAVLSALNRNAAQQWQGLRDAVEAARADGLAVDVLVFVGEQDLLNTINADIAGGLQGVRVATIPDRTSDLEGLIGEFQPQVLHFFCHGSVSHGVPRLELATILDWLDGKTTGSLKVSMADLQSMPALANVWLVLLNCCESGRAEENMHSMAHTLVANVVPAAIGMLEPFDASDAHEFCSGFYPQLFKELIETLNAPANGNLVELEWATALRGARKGLSEKHQNDPNNHREWALPVLYARPEPFLLRIEAAPIDSEQVQAWKQKAEVVAGQLKALAPDTDMEVREAVLGILADVPEWLRPDPFGDFEGAVRSLAHGHHLRGQFQG